MDGIITDCERALCEIHNRPSPYVHPINNNVYDMSSIWIMNAEHFWAHCEHDFWANMHWTPDGKEILALVEETFSPENVCLLSSPTRNKGCMGGKLEWLEKHMPQYSRRFFFGTAKHFAARPNAVLVDDKNENVDLFTQHGGHAFLYPRPWNRRYSSTGVALATLKYFLRTLG